MNYIKGQTILDHVIWQIAVLIIVAVTITTLLLFFTASGNSLPIIQISSQYNKITGSEVIQLLLPRVIKEPENINLYINNISTKISLKNASFYYVAQNSTYIYTYNLSISNNQTLQKLFSSNSSRIVLVSYLDSSNKTIYSSTLNYVVGTTTPLSYKSGQYITFNIVPITTSWEIILKNNSYSTGGQILTNGKKIYLPNGNYYIEAKQVNSSSTLYFKNWYALPFYGGLSVSSNNTESSTLTVENTSGIVSLYLGYSGLITFASNKESAINNQSNFTCGENETRFCIDNSIRNLNFTYYENKTSFSFNYPQLLSGNTIEKLSFEYFNTSFVNKATGEDSCQTGFNIFNNSQTVSNVGPTSCILYAEYTNDYRVVANTSNSSQGNVSIYTAYNGKTETGNKVIVWVPIGTSAQVIANPKTYYKFSNFTETPGNQIITTTPYSFTVSSSSNYTAYFDFNPATISWSATSNLGSVSASFTANAIPSNSLTKWQNITAGTTPYTFTFNKTNVFSANSLNTSFTFNGEFASTISPQHGSQQNGTFTGLNIYCGSTSVNESSTESYSYNWKASNDCQNVTIEAKYYLTPKPPPPPPKNTTTSGGSGVFNANMTQFLLKDVYPIGVGMNLTTSNMYIANFTVYYISNGQTYTYNNPLLSNSHDNFSFEQVDAHKQFGNYIDGTYGTSNGEIFQYIPGTNTTQVFVAFPQKFVYSGKNYSFDISNILLNYTFTFKNGTDISTTVVGPYKNLSKYTNIQLNTSFASNVFHNDTPEASGKNATYVSSYTLNMTVAYINQIQHSGELKVINYPDSITNLSVSIPSTMSYQEQKQTLYYSNTTDYLITSTAPTTYSITLSALLKQPDFKGEYILSVYDNSTKTSIYYNNQTDAGTAIQISNLLSNQTYTIMGIYYVPITIATNFLGQQFAFNSENQYSPYEIGNFIDNNYEEVYNLFGNNQYIIPSAPYYMLGYQNATFFSYPSTFSNIGYTQPGSTPTIQDGYWNDGTFYPDTTLIGSSSLLKCAETGEVGSCITFDGILPGAKYNSLYSGVLTETVPSSIGTLPGITIQLSHYPLHVYFGNINTSCPSGDYCNEFFGQGVTQESFHYYSLSSSFLGIDVPATVNLNYGYYIPVYLGANANYSGWCVSSYYDGSYSSLSEAINDSANSSLNLNINNNTCGDATNLPGRPHPELSLYMKNVNTTSSSFGIQSNKISYTELKEICSSSSCQSLLNIIVYHLNNSPSGFTSTSPLIKDEGSSTLILGNNEYDITASYPSSWSVNNGYIFYEYDSG